jgi:hypothetical protein
VTAYGGMLEGTVTVPTGGWDVAANAGAGSFTATVPAGDYFVTDLADELEQQLNAGAGGTWTITISKADLTGTGIVTVSNTAEWSLAWTDTDLRDVLGHNDNFVSIPAGQSRTFDFPATGIWIPDCPKWTPYGDGNFERNTDLRQSIAPSGGGVKTLVGNTFDFLDSMRWDMVGNARAVGLDAPGSWQHFWSALFTGRFTYIQAGKPVRLHWSADDSGGVAANTVNLVVPTTSSMDAVTQGWTGLYRITIPRMVKVS